MVVEEVFVAALGSDVVVRCIGVVFVADYSCLVVLVFLGIVVVE